MKGKVMELAMRKEQEQELEMGMVMKEEKEMGMEIEIEIEIEICAEEMEREQVHEMASLLVMKKILLGVG